MPADPALLATLPRVDTVVAACGHLVPRFGSAAVTATVRAVLDAVRTALRDGTADQVPSVAALVAVVAADLQGRRPGPPRPVLNASGVVVHTNLGRAPLSAAAVAAVTRAAGTCDVEVDLATGTRSSRTARLTPLLVEATGAQDAHVVNNAAAALVLVLAALAPGRQVIVSRGELVEIGGSFRLPEIMAAAGARLLEVGTTNMTRAADYRGGDDVALLLKVHPSNFAVSGFTHAASVEELAAVARERGIPLVHDTGSGLLVADAHPALAYEPSVQASLAAGADLVVCSGDKLLGGPQAGLLIGRADLVDRCRRHPLARALRLDKLRVAALVATLEAHLRGSIDELPVWRALLADAEGLRARAVAVAEAVGGTVAEGSTLVGGGAAPEAALASAVVRLDVDSPGAVAAALRTGDPAVLARVDRGAVWLDLRAIDPADDAALVQAVRAALDALPPSAT